MKAMRALLLGVVLSFVSVCYGYHHHHHHLYDTTYAHHIPGPLMCYQSHQPGYFFYHVNGRYYPDYRNPKFFRTWKYRSWYPFPRSNNQYAHQNSGFTRCHNKEGLSIECYDRSTKYSRSRN